MDKILAPIKNRILQFIDYNGIAKGNFFKELNISASNFRSNSLYSEVGGDVIAKISSLRPDLNLVWLITGEGEMLITDQESKESPKEAVNEQDRDELWERLRQSYEEIGMLKAKNRQLTDEIALLKKELDTIRADLEATAVKLDSAKLKLAVYEQAKSR